ncbi:oligosaccharide flippase family protein [Clostridium nigeriense]|uniref:oligosaccharide flippase family protein n=1 Tax=Clostridium nigeriense TaxID=1805470 RepID=UPI000833BE2D|nr:oligosaccharide flippase family protein [Clostridium nigeriense]
MLKDSLILTFSKGIRGVLMLIFNMIIARLFTESLYGTYKQVNLIINLVTSICVVGIPTTISYFYITSDKKDKERLIGNTIVILGLIAAISSFSIVLFKEKVALLLNNPNILNYITLLSLQIFIMIISSFLENLYISSNSTVALGKIYVIYTIVNFLTLGFVTISTRNLYYLLLVMVIIEFLRTMFMYYIIRSRESLKFRTQYSLLVKQIKFAIPLGVVALVQNLNMYVDNLFISNRFNPEEYAAYANAATDIPLVSIITISIASVVLPRMSKSYAENKNSKEVLSIWGESCKKTALIMFPIFWIALLFSREYIELIFSYKYVESSTPIFIIYLLKFPLYFTVFGNILIVIKQQKYVMVNSIMGIVLNIILNIIFLNIFGIIGPAISTVIVHYFMVYLQLVKISKGFEIKLKDVLPYKKLIKIFLLPAIIAIPIYFISSIINISSILKFIVFGGVIYLVTMIIFIKIGYISKKDLNFIKRS